MNPNVIKSAISDISAVEQAMWLQMNEHPIKDLNSDHIADAVKSSLGHMMRAMHYLEAARRVAERRDAMLREAAKRQAEL